MFSLVRPRAWLKGGMVRLREARRMGWAGVDEQREAQGMMLEAPWNPSGAQPSLSSMLV